MIVCVKEVVDPQRFEFLFSVPCVGGLKVEMISCYRNLYRKKRI